LVEGKPGAQAAAQRRLELRNDFQVMSMFSCFFRNPSAKRMKYPAVRSFREKFRTGNDANSKICENYKGALL